MVINTNISALYASRMLSRNEDKLKGDIEKLSSGRRINRASDDPAGLAISERMKAQIAGLGQASRNASDGVALMQTAEGYLSENHDILQRLRVLAVQSANGIYSDIDRKQSQYEVNQLLEEIDRISNIAQFNNIKLLNGNLDRGNQQVVANGSDERSADGNSPNAPVPETADSEAEATLNDSISSGEGLLLHIGANVDEEITAYIGDMSTKALGITNVKLSTQKEANQAIATIDEAINRVSGQRANIGAYQNRLESAIKTLDIGSENLTAYNSRIADADMAKVSVSYAKDTILNQTALAVLVQANAQTQGVLELLR